MIVKDRLGLIKLRDLGHRKSLIAPACSKIAHVSQFQEKAVTYVPVQTEMGGNRKEVEGKKELRKFTA